MQMAVDISSNLKLLLIPFPPFFPSQVLNFPATKSPSSYPKPLQCIPQSLGVVPTLNHRRVKQPRSGTSRASATMSKIPGWARLFRRLVVSCPTPTRIRYGKFEGVPMGVLYRMRALSAPLCTGKFRECMRISRSFWSPGRSLSNTISAMWEVILVRMWIYSFFTWNQSGYWQSIL